MVWMNDDDDDDDDDIDSQPEDRFIGFYATWGWDEWGGFSLPT